MRIFDNEYPLKPKNAGYQTIKELLVHHYGFSFKSDSVYYGSLLIMVKAPSFVKKHIDCFTFAYRVLFRTLIRETLLKQYKREYPYIVLKETLDNPNIEDLIKSLDERSESYENRAI